MTIHTAYVTLPSAEFDRINRLLKIDCLEEMSDEQLKERGVNTNVCEEIFYVEFDNGAILSFALCSGFHNYYDNMVWTSPVYGKHDLTLDCKYELDDDIEVKIDNELYIVKIFHDDKFRIHRSDNFGEDDTIMVFNTKEEAEKGVEEDLKKFKDKFKEQKYEFARFLNIINFWIDGEEKTTCWLRMYPCK